MLHSKDLYSFVNRPLAVPLIFVRSIDMMAHDSLRVIWCLASCFTVGTGDKTVEGVQ